MLISDLHGHQGFQVFNHRALRSKPARLRDPRPQKGEGRLSADLDLCPAGWAYTPASREASAGVFLFPP